MRQGTIWLLVSLAVVLVFWANSRQPNAPTPGSSETATRKDSRPDDSPATRRVSLRRATGPASAPEAEENAEEEGPFTREQIAAYLAKNNRNAASLLTAFDYTEDRQLLIEAAQNFPDDPRVQLAVLSNNLFPEEVRSRLDRFQATNPDNALGNYLSALEYASADQAAMLKELRSAAGKPTYNTFADERFQDVEAMALFLGASPADSMLLAMSCVSSPQQKIEGGLARLASRLLELQRQTLAAGDAAAAQEIADIGLDMASHFSAGPGGRFVMTQMIAQSIERNLLRELEPTARYDESRTIGERVAELESARQELRELSAFLPTIYPKLSEAELTSYLNRVKSEGELSALKWLKQNYGSR